ncbi:hypothetical protein ES703_114094 [subsurface metagenome]
MKLKTAGCDIDITGQHWIEAGNFEEEVHSYNQSLVRDKQERGSLKAYCFKCRTKVEIKNPKLVTLKNGRPAIKGVCPVCGAKIFRIGF